MTVRNSAPQPPPLAFERLTVRYPGVEQASVSAVSLSVHAGERVGLLGPSGAGKTTILNVAAGLVAPTHGAVRLFGAEPSTRTEAARRQIQRNVGMVHQQLALVPSVRVRTNVAAGRIGDWSLLAAVREMVRPGNQQEILETLSTLGIADKARARTSSLSGGQQQRVALARVLYQKPSLLLADEPVSSVDPGWANEVLTLLSAYVEASGAGLLVSLHDPVLANRWCDRLVGLRHGAIVFDAPTNTVSKSDLDSLYAVASTS